MKVNRSTHAVSRTVTLLGVLLSTIAWIPTASAATLYVWSESPGPAQPYSTWAAAAHTIQQAVDAATAGDEIVVTNGVYATGGRAVFATMTNRVAVTKPVFVRSVNGALFTIIEGRQVPGGGIGGGAIRCVYLAAGARLSGFTLTNGATSGLGLAIPERSGGGVLCESNSAVVSHCTITRNLASWGGGGAYGGTLSNCTLTGNGAYDGGGAYESVVYHCALTGNSASREGGGASRAELNHCTLTGNSAASGGGITGSALSNCIVYYNTALSTAEANYALSSSGFFSLSYCCTTPLPPGGAGNVSLEPLLTDASHLSADSPCRGAGSPATAPGTDIDGESWGSPPSIGCDEYAAGPATGPLSVAFTASYATVANGFAVDLRGTIGGRASANAWDFGDGVVLSNRPSVRHAWSAPGTYTVTLRAWNDSQPTGVSASATVQVLDTIHHVAADSGSPAWPFATWATAARTIQEAVDVAVPGALVLVSNGVYAAGGRAVYGRMTNRVALDKPIEVRSLNGPEVTVIQGRQVPGTTNGEGAIRCVYLTNGAVLSGFILTGGATRGVGDYRKDLSGGGAWCETADAVVTNCALVGNSASEYGGGAYSGTLNHCLLTRNSATNGGGAYDATLNNCIVTGNSAAREGGGAYAGRLNNCTVTGNSGNGYGGGTYSGTLNNCILYSNTVRSGSGPDYAGGTFHYCCAPGLPLGGGNVTNTPLFVDYVGGNFRLQANSPCIDAGGNAFVPGSTDLDGQPRIARLRVDIGAYEYQGPGRSPYVEWLQQHGLPVDGSADFTDPDHDQANTWQEWVADTDPTNALSVLRVECTSPTAPATVRFLSSPNRLYTLRYADSLFEEYWVPLWFDVPGQTDIPGTGGWQTLTDSNPSALRFYRVSVRQP